jgi:hypothetical protein
MKDQERRWHHGLKLTSADQEILTKPKLELMHPPPSTIHLSQKHIDISSETTGPFFEAVVPGLMGICSL